MKWVSAYDSDLTPKRDADLINEFANAYQNTLEDVLGENIFSGEFGRLLNESQSTLYVENRGNPSGSELDKYSLEDEFHNAFFPPNPPDRSNLILLSGIEGVGKTTFLRHYFDCFLHSLKSEFKIIVLYCDLRRCTTFADLKERLFDQIRVQICRLNPNISIENDFAMWHRKARWDDPIHAVVEQNYEGRAVYRASVVQNDFHNNELFVREALWYLLTQRKENGDRYYFPTLIADNVDQLNYLVQVNLVKLLVDLAEGACSPKREDDFKEYYFWRVVFPMRPETMTNLAFYLSPLSSHRVIPVKMPDQIEVLERRSRQLSTIIAATRTQVDRIYVEKESGTNVYAPLTSSEVAKHFTRAIKVQDVGADPSRPSPLRMPDNVAALMSNLSNDSLRRLLRLKRHVALNSGLAEHIRNLLKWGHATGHLSAYRVLDAIIVGPHDYYNKFATDSDMMNIFELSTIERPNSTSSYLIGTHVLHLLGRQLWKASDLKRTLCELGHSLEDVEDCFTVFFNKGLYKKNVSEETFGKDFVFDVQRPICEAFKTLIEHPAYIDNMAMVTKVPEALIARMCITRTYNLEDFFSRALTSLAFLQQLHEAEIEFTTYSNRRIDSDRLAFEAKLSAAILPSIYSRAAYNYRLRLEGLREEPAGLGEIMGDEDWLSLIGDEALIVPSRNRHAALRAQ